MRRAEKMYVHSNAGPPLAQIAGVGTYLPDWVVASSELEDELRSSGVAIPSGFIERATGIESRRHVLPGENASDLAVAASREALTSAGLSAEDVDILIFAAASHDVTEPATANIVQAKLGAHRAVVFDLKNACNSLLSALDVADGYVRLRRARVVLVATGEVPSIVTDRRVSSREELTANFSHFTMGDAGGAIVLTPSDDRERGILATAAVTRGTAWELGTVLSFGSMYPRDVSPGRALLRSRSCELEARARTDVPAVMQAVLEAAGWKPETVDVVACHQHTRKIACELSSAIGMRPERLALPLRYAGNAAAANIPLALADAARNGRLQTGARVLLCGGSAGFSAIATAVAW
jgi:3-oxoacyl-(acyl-carrier-protein) synthase III